MRSIKQSEIELRRAFEPEPSYEEFEPDCLGHVESMISIARDTDTDETVRKELKAECVHSNEFPSKQAAGAEKERLCGKFARVLSKAHRKERDTGSKQGYVDFCKSYYKHRGGDIDEEPPATVAAKAEPAPAKPDKHANIVFVLITIIACVAFVLVIYFILRRGS